MIKLIRSAKPKQLTEQLQEQLTKEFKADHKKAVWNKEYIRQALLAESNNKCAYCEAKVGTGHREMHIDHFHYKDKYENEVVEWENLVPSCPHCNKSKSVHDTYILPIVNPYEQNPQDFFYIKNYRYYSKNDSVDNIVRQTVGVLGLNDTYDVVKLRFLLGEEILGKIQEIYELAEENRDILCEDIRKKNRVLNGCKNLLKKGVRTAEFGAFMATTIQTDDYFKRLKKLLQELELWNDDLSQLDEESRAIVLSTHASIEKEG